MWRSERNKRADDTNMLSYMVGEFDSMIKNLQKICLMVILGVSAGTGGALAGAARVAAAHVQQDTQKEFRDIVDGYLQERDFLRKRKLDESLAFNPLVGLCIKEHGITWRIVSGEEITDSTIDGGTRPILNLRCECDTSTRYSFQTYVVRLDARPREDIVAERIPPMPLKSVCGDISMAVGPLLLFGAL